MTRSRSPANALATALAAGLLVLGTLAAPAFAQSSAQWPQRAVKFILPLGPGSGVDISGRLLAERLQKRWGQSVVVENRPGGDGIVAIGSFVSAADDHQLLYTPTGSFTVHPYQKASLPYDAKQDLLPIARVTSTILAVGVPASADFGTLRDFVARARAEPGKMNAAVVPGITELVFDGFVKSSGLSIAKVPYRDIVQAATDLGENRIQFMMAALAILRPQVQANRIRLVAINGPVRTELFPDVPTAAEAGVPALSMEGLVGLFGPRGMDLELRKRIAADVIAVIRDPEISARLIGTAQALNPGGPAELAASVDAQTEQIAAIAKSLGMVPK
jgi:tripartite-type tricarboxylate transporter receptor subunit TctC